MPTFVALMTSLAVVAGASGPQEPDAPNRLLISRIAVSDRYVVFSHAGDLWRVGRAGGVAERLTEGPTEDDYPAFSPAGTWVAFTRDSADNRDVYIVPPLGGEPRRLTYNPELDIVRGWNLDGTRVLFMSHRDEEGVFRLYTVGTDGVLPRALPLPRGYEGAYSPDGKRLAYLPRALPRDLLDTDWRYYRGGATSPIWIARLEDSSIEKLPRADSAEQRVPMWIGQRIYFISDRSGTPNLHVYDTRARQVRQLTHFRTYGVRHAAAGGGTIALLRDGRVHLFDPANGGLDTLDIRVDPDTSQLTPRAVPGAPYVQSAAPGPAGERVALGVRGDVVVFDTESGAARNLTASPGAAERYPAISPDGRWIAYFTDQSGEYRLRIRPLEGEGRARTNQIELRPTFYRELTWSPDSRRLAFSDKRLSLWIADIETGGARRVDSSNYSGQELYHPAWSPDGSVLAYSKHEDNRVRAIYLYDVNSGASVRVSDGRAWAEHPAFDRSGRYLYFVASNTAGLAEFGWSVLSGRLFRPLVSRSLHAVVLQNDEPAPFLPILGDPNPAAARRSDSVRTVIHARGIGDRIVPLPLPNRDYAGLAAGAAGELFVLSNEWPDSPAPGSMPQLAVHRWRRDRPGTLERFLTGIDEFRLSATGNRILYRKGERWALVPSSAPPGSADGTLDLSNVQLRVDPRAEWRQIHHEAWRIMRDWFYDPNHHGQDIRTLERHYASYLPTVTRRQDLNLLLRRGLGHVSVSHLAVSGGDTVGRSGERANVGLLGADYTVEKGRYRISRIYRSGAFSSSNALLRAPLDAPTVEVSEGDYLLSVDGQRIDATRNVHSYFQGKALQPVEIQIGPRPSGEGARTFTVVPVPGENSLRRANWVKRNRQIVEEEGNTKLGYVYISNFGSGLDEAVRDLLADRERAGLVVDMRFAPGGITSDYLIEGLRRQPLYYYAFREGEDLPVPTNPMPKAKTLLVNDMNTSAAETFALMWKLGGLGDLVGTRTLGAGIGPYLFIPPLIDGGRVSVPNRAAYVPGGGWGIENRGVAPDIEVEWSPADWRQGRDVQLRAAIRAALQRIVDDPPESPERPEYPKHPDGEPEADGSEPSSGDRT